MSSANIVPSGGDRMPDISRTEDEEKIRRLVTAFGESWNSHDMPAMALALFADDIEWVNIVGMYWRGMLQVRAGFANIHETIFANTTCQIDSCTIRLLISEIAISVVTLSMGSFLTPDGKHHEPAQNRLSFVLRKLNGQWKITHGHNTVVDAQALRFDPVNRA